MIRPNQKRQKDQKRFTEALKKGKNVITIGGMHGKICAVSEYNVTLEVDKGIKLTFEKTAISLEATRRLEKTQQKES